MYLFAFFFSFYNTFPDILIYKFLPNINNGKIYKKKFAIVKHKCNSKTEIGKENREKGSTVRLHIVSFCLKSLLNILKLIFKKRYIKRRVFKKLFMHVHNYFKPAFRLSK